MDHNFFLKKLFYFILLKIKNGFQQEIPWSSWPWWQSVWYVISNMTWAGTKITLIIVACKWSKNGWLINMIAMRIFFKCKQKKKKFAK